MLQHKWLLKRRMGGSPPSFCKRTSWFYWDTQLVVAHCFRRLFRFARACVASFVLIFAYVTTSLSRNRPGIGPTVSEITVCRVSPDAARCANTLGRGTNGKKTASAAKKYHLPVDGCDGGSGQDRTLEIDTNLIHMRV